MLAIPEPLRHLRAAARAILTRVARIHLDQAHTGPLCLVAQHREELGPRRVVDILGKGATRERLHPESFDRDHIVVAHQPRARLMEVIGALAGDRGMATAYHDACLPPSLGTRMLPRHRPLCAPQASRRTACCLETGNCASVGQGGEGGDPKVDADCARSIADWRCRQLDCESHVPTLHIPPKGAVLNYCQLRHRPMQMHAEGSGQALESNPVILQRDTAKLSKAEAIEPSLAAEARKAWLAAAFHAPEEPSIRLVQASERRPLQVCGQGRCLGVVSPPF